MNKEHDMKKMISWITATIVALSFGLMGCANLEPYKEKSK